MNALQTRFGNMSGDMRFAIATKPNQLLGHAIRVKAPCLQQHIFTDGKIAAPNLIGRDFPWRLGELDDAQ